MNFPLILVLNPVELPAGYGDLPGKLLKIVVQHDLVAALQRQFEDELEELRELAHLDLDLCFCVSRAENLHAELDF